MSHQKAGREQSAAIEGTQSPERVGWERPEPVGIGDEGRSGDLRGSLWSAIAIWTRTVCTARNW